MLKPPSTALCTVRFRPVAELLTVIVAPLIAPPLESFTCPTRLASPPCPIACGTSKVMPRLSTRITKACIALLFMRSSC